MTTIVTGGLGFIGSNFVFSHLKKYPSDHIVVVDNQSYASNTKNLFDYIQSKYSSSLFEDYRFSFRKVDIRDSRSLELLYDRVLPDITFHFAAESHVDNSISGDDEFLSTNIDGTHNILKCIRKYGGKLVHISTDEVYGSLSLDAPGFTEETPYDPRNPYSATKAASDHLVRSYVNTHKIQAVVTNCSNNYGPRQHAEKLIPTIIRKAKADEPISIYGDGQNVRDWLYVDDHCEALLAIGKNFIPGDRFNIGGGFEINNLDLTHLILDMMNKPRSLVKFVEDRKGHDLRYSINSSKIRDKFNWQPKVSFNDGLVKTLEWYNNA